MSSAVEILPGKREIELRELHVGKGRPDIEYESPRRIEELQLGNRLRQLRLLDPSLALGAALDHVVGADDTFIHRDAAFHQVAIRPHGVDRDHWIRTEAGRHHRGRRHRDVEAFGEQRQVVIERLRHRLIDGDRYRWRHGLARAGRAGHDDAGDQEKAALRSRHELPYSLNRTRAYRRTQASSPAIGSADWERPERYERMGGERERSVAGVADSGAAESARSYGRAGNNSQALTEIVSMAGPFGWMEAATAASR